VEWEQEPGQTELGLGPERELEQAEQQILKLDLICLTLFRQIYFSTSQFCCSFIGSN
jgi:hypothetical protein